MSEDIAKQSNIANNADNIKNPSLGWMIGFLFVVSFLGLFSVVPLQKIMIIDYKLIYPSGTTTAHLINSFHTPQGAKLAKKQVKVLGKLFSFSFLWGFFQWFFTGGDGCGFANFPTFGLKAYENKFYFDFSATYVGVGMICPYIINVSVLLGGIISWGLMWPLIESKKGDWYSVDPNSGSLQGLQGYKVDQNQAISMVSYFASSSEPAQVRGKTVYIQYSNRQEIVNNKSSGDVAGNVLLVTIEGVEAGDVSIDVIHLVFSAFGFVHKIATFEKAAGFQALIQFTDAETASSARNALDGRSIPKYLLPETVQSCHLRISYSAHTDLNIKFQSHRSRDYTNPYLPVNPSAIEGTMQSTLGPDGKKKEPESNVLLASIENLQYAVTVDVLHTVFSAFGTVHKIAIFDKNGGMQALIQYPDVTTAAVAKEALEGHCIYDGGYCKLHLSYSRHTDLNVKAHSDRSRDYTIPEGLLPMQQATAAVPTTAGWQSTQASVAYPGNEYAVGMQGQLPDGHMPHWDISMQANRSTFVSVPSSFPGQTYTSPGVPGYPSAGLPGSAPLQQAVRGLAGVAPFPHGMPPYGQQPNVGASGTPPLDQPHYYGQ